MNNSFEMKTICLVRPPTQNIISLCLQKRYVFNETLVMKDYIISGLHLLLLTLGVQDKKYLEMLWESPGN